MSLEIERARSSSAGAFLAWRTVGGCLLALSIGYSCYIAYFFGLFIKPLQAEFGYSRAAISVALSLCTLTVVVASPAAGWLVDRYNPRSVIAWSIVAFAAVCATAALIPMSLPTFYALHVVLAIAAIGTLPGSFTRIVVAWFDQRRGLALGIALAGIALGPVAVVPLLQRVIDHGGWRSGYLALAALMLCIGLPATLLLIRSSPQAYGLAFDGRPAVASVATRTSAVPVEPLSAALWRKTTLLLVISFFLMGIAGLGFTTHIFAMLLDSGISSTHAASAVSVLGLGLLCGRLLSGIVLDRLPARFVSATVVAGMSVGLMISTTPSTAWVGIALVGFGLGAEFDFLAYLISRYFSLAHYGKIYGISYSAFQVGCAAGAVAVGWAFDRFGSYDVAFKALGVISLIAAALFLLFGPQPHSAMSAEPVELVGERIGPQAG